MTQQQFETACAANRAILTAKNTEAPCRVPDKPWVRAHLLWMLDEAVGRYVTNPGKAQRWLGFVQGCMACNGWANLETLKRANMPEGEAFDPGKM